MIASLLRNTRADVCFYILHDETLTEENRGRLQETYGSNSSNEAVGMRFMDISDYFAAYRTREVDEMCLRFTRGSLYRLCLHEVLPGLENVIYLDCDVVVNLDIADLWRFYLDDGGKRSILGVYGNRESSEPDINIPRAEIKTDKRGFNRERYINSGVLALNLVRLREKYKHGEMLKGAVDYTMRFHPKTPDQDFINAEFLGDILYADPKYNFAPDKNYDEVFSLERVWHFYLKGKPWQLVTGSNADTLYWRYLMATPWRDEIVESFYSAAVNDLYYHRHSSDCINRLTRRLVENIKNLKRLFK